ncbi:MAG: beta-propeller fold lactonase family protein [Thermoleophilia bacterium]|nr:beta-propeller fold lactonase family protein [Thermoleophilia bacterium]
MRIVATIAAAAGALALCGDALAASVDGALQLPGKAGCSSSAGADGCTEVAGLDGAAVAAVSPDGRNVYVAARTADALVSFRRDPASGRLTRLAGTGGCVSAGGPGDDCEPGHGLDYVYDLAVSPDGRNVYVASSGPGGTIAVLARDPATGGLTQLEGADGCVSRTGEGGCGFARGMPTPRALAFSPDGKLLYAAGFYVFPPNYVTRVQGVVVFARDPETGALEQLAGAAGCVEDGGRDGCTAQDMPFDLSAVAASPDGGHVLAGGSFQARALGTTATGGLVPIGGTGGCVASSATAGCTHDPQIAPGIAYAPDGMAYLGLVPYVFEGSVLRKIGNAPRLQGVGVATLLVDPRGDWAYGSGVGGVAVLSRGGTGTLAQLPGEAGCLAVSSIVCRDARALETAGKAALSPDGRHLYVPASGSNAIAILATPDATAPAVGLAKSARVAGGKAAIRVSCPATETRCSGTLALLAGAKAVGQAAFAVWGGSSQVVRVGARGVTLPGKATARATASDLHGNTRVTAVTVRLAGRP